MECSNCQFQNMPGVQSLRSMRGQPATGLAGDRRSPAARQPRGKTLAAVVPVRRCTGTASAAAAGRAAAFKRWSDLARRPAGPGCSCGWSFPVGRNGYIGPGQRGRWMFWCYVAALLSGLLFAGTALGLILLGLAVCGPCGIDHWTSWPRGVVSFQAAAGLLRRGPVLAGGRASTIRPAKLVGCVATPSAIRTWPRLPLRPADVVLVNPSAYRWSDPQPGDVVHYSSP